MGAVRCRERLGPAEVLREGSGIKVDGTAGHGLTISVYIEDPGISPGKRAPGPDLSSTWAEQSVLAQGNGQDEFIDRTRHLRLLFDYVLYYHEDRTHLGLGKEIP